MVSASFKEMGMRVMRATITRTVRQGARSGILYNATWLRRAMQQQQLPEPQLTVTPFDDVEIVSPEDLEDSLGMSLAEYGEEQTILITRSNHRAVDFNLAIRRQIFDREEIIAKGDRLLISKNNYFWTTRARQQRAQALRDGAQTGAGISGLPLPALASGEEERQVPVPDFLANGEVAVVEDIYSTETRDQILFADVSLRLVDSGATIDAKIILDSLTSESAGLQRDKYETIGRRALADAGVTSGSMTAQREALRQSPYFNALQVKYAYAVTCHKAQGGQWESVFVDMGYIPPEAYLTTDFYRWLYTSVTRASRRLSLLNPSCRIR